MTLILIYNDRTATIDFIAAFNDYCCIFDEICKVIKETFNLSNLLSDYHMVYYDPSYNLWINFNIHVTKRITQVIRESTSKTLKIRVEQCQKNISTLFAKKKTIDKVEPKPIEDGCAHLIIWLDAHIRNPSRLKLKRDCQAIINTNASFTTDDNIDTLIQYNSFKYNTDLTRKPNTKYFIETADNFSCPFQCALFTADNTDIFFEYLNMALKLARSLSIIISEHFAKEILPIILSRKQNRLLPDVLFLYVHWWDINSHYDWALKYIDNDDFSVPEHLQFFNDEQELFARLLNDVSGHLTSEADRRRLRKEPWHALQYYEAARQLLLNSCHWATWSPSHMLQRLYQLIKESKRETTKFLLDEYNNDKHRELEEKIAQECAEI